MHHISSNNSSLWPSWHQEVITSKVGKQHKFAALPGFQSASAGSGKSNPKQVFLHFKLYLIWCLTSAEYFSWCPIWTSLLFPLPYTGGQTNAGNPYVGVVPSVSCHSNWKMMAARHGNMVERLLRQCWNR